MEPVELTNAERVIVWTLCEAEIMLLSGGHYGDKIDFDGIVRMVGHLAEIQEKVAPE